MNMVYKGNNLAFSFLQLISEKINKNTNIKSQNVKTSVKNCCTSNLIKVFNNFSSSASNKIIYSSKFLAESLKPVKSKTHQQDLLVPFSNPWVVRRIKEDSNDQVQLVLLSLVCKERREEVTDKLVECIYQLSAEDVEVVVGTLKKLICFVKGGKGKQLTLPVIVIRLDNNSQIDTQALVDSGCTGSCINQQFVVNYKIPIK